MREVVLDEGAEDGRGGGGEGEEGAGEREGDVWVREPEWDC